MADKMTLYDRLMMRASVIEDANTSELLREAAGTLGDLLDRPTLVWLTLREIVTVATALQVAMEENKVTHKYAESVTRKLDDAVGIGEQ